MKNKIFCLTVLLLLIFCFGIVALAGNKIKNRFVVKDELSLVHTAVGIATIIQLPEAVESVIIGDQGGFKIEYLDKAITIKPLRFGAKTNLYVNTQSRRYNIRLLTGSQELADYIFYLSPFERKEKSNILWREYKRSFKSENFELEAKRIGKAKDGFIFVDLTISSKEKVKLDPDKFGVFQGKNLRVMQSLYLSSIEADGKHPVQILVVLDPKDLSTELPAEFQYKSDEILKIELSREVLWTK